MLAIDAGNTNIKWGKFKDSELVSVEVCRGSYWSAALTDGVSIRICSVVPKITSKFIIEARQKGCDVFELTSDYNFGFKIEYDLSQIGVDRLAAMYGAKKLYNSNNILLIDLGSALTIDLLHDNVFCGGIIYPGPEMSAKMLDKNTQLIDRKSVTEINGFFGKNTSQAVSAGILNALYSLVNNYISKYKNEIEDLVVVGTGGGLGFLEDKCEFDYVDKFLVLKALASM